MSLELLTQNMFAQCGQEGLDWIASLPKIIDQISQKHRVYNLKPYEILTYHYVASGFIDDQPVVVKVGYDQTFLENEARALCAFKGTGVVTLIHQGEGYLVLEKLEPGESLATMINNDQDVDLFCKTMNQLHETQFENRNFKTLREWVSIFDEQRNLPDGYLERAGQIRDHMCEDNKPVVLLHGDLHHDNILSSSNGWKAIDPKGVIGIPMYDATSFVVNPIRMLHRHDEETLKILFKRRIQIIASLQKWKEADLAACCFMYTILSWIWSLQDGTEAVYQKKCANIFNSLL